MLLPFSGTYYYFSKGLSSKESETSLVASRIEDARILTEQVRLDPEKC